jgi:hypothetical protein
VDGEAGGGVVLKFHHSKMNTINWTDIVVAIAAFWGALLSTVIFIKDLKKGKSKLQVKTATSLLGLPTGSRWQIRVKAINTGSVTIKLAAIHIAMPDGKNYVQIHSPTSPSLPYDLPPHESYTHFFDEERFRIKAKELGLVGKIKIVPFVTDQMEKDYRSKPFKINLK